MRRVQGNIFLNGNTGGYASFIQEALASLDANFYIDGASFYEYDGKYYLLHLRVCHAGGMSYDHEDHVKPEEGTAVFHALETMTPVCTEVPSGIHLYYPFAFESSDSAGEAAHIGLIRLERRLGHNTFSENEIRKISNFLEGYLKFYYKAEYFSLLRMHEKNLIAATSLAEVFAKSLNKQSRNSGESDIKAKDTDDSLRVILSGVQMRFGFDRVRLFLVEKTEDTNILKGELSVDITGKVHQLSFEQIPLEAGVHRFADIVLQKNSEAFLDYYRKYIVYLPLVVGGEVIGLMIGDNFISQQPIEKQELALLRSLGTQMALAVHNIRLFKKVQAMAQYDALTRLPLRTYFDERCQEELYRSIRYGHKLSFMFVDIDLFKVINDSFSHQIGDEVLRAIANTIIKTIRQKIDFPGRFGGDEMVIFLPQSSSEEAKGLAARLHEAIGRIRIDTGDSREIKLSVSIGIATCPDDAENMETLKNNADLALYWVKEHGRGKTMAYADLPKGYAEERARREAKKKPGTR